MSTDANTGTAAPHRQRPAGSGGRTRDIGRDHLILEAVLDLISEQGANALSMEAVAARAQVGKSTVYRRWKGLPDLIADAVDTITFAASHLASAEGLRERLVEGIIAASGCMDPRRQRTISSLLNSGHDQVELVDALRDRFINAIASAIDTARDDGAVRVSEAEDPSWPSASIDLAVVIGLLTSLPHITGHALQRSDFERIVDEALLPLWASRGYID